MGRQLSTMRKRFFPLLLLPLGIGLSGFLLLKYPRKSSRKKTLSASSVFDEALKGSGYESMTRFIFAQSQVESANFTSNLFISQNNAFGMKNARIRPTTGFPVEGTEFAGYTDLKSSIQDLLLWFDYTGFPNVSDVNTYVRKLKDRNYFEEGQQDYINAMNSWL